MGNTHKDIYKAIKHSLTDRVMAVRSATAKVIKFKFFSLCIYIYLYGLNFLVFV